jgi:hypothetical protein
MIDTTVSRRQLLAGVSVTAAAGLAGSATPSVAKAPMQSTQAPAFYRFRVGSIEATVISDGRWPSVRRRKLSSVQRLKSSAR